MHFFFLYGPTELAGLRIKSSSDAETFVPPVTVQNRKVASRRLEKFKSSAEFSRTVK